MRVPETAAPGEAFTIRALISHPMESGQRRDTTGALVPRKIIHSFRCEFEGETVFACTLEPAVAANPYFEFDAKLAKSGTFRFVWEDDDGSVYSHEQAIAVG